MNKKYAVTSNNTSYTLRAYALVLRVIAPFGFDVVYAGNIIRHCVTLSAQRMKRHQKTLERMNKRLKELIDSFDESVKHFDRTPIFSGPSLYFHKKVIDVLRTSEFLNILENESFFEYLYATLASLGLRRMGETNTKLINFDKFKESTASQKERALSNSYEWNRLSV